MKRSSLLPLIAGATVTLGACTDLPSSPNSALTPLAARNSAASGAAIQRERATIRRFDVEIEPEGPLVPGKRIGLKITTTNHLDARSAEVSVRLPEAAVARLRHWKGGAPTNGLHVRPEFSEAKVVAAGARVVTHGWVQFDAPGMYRVIARVDPSADAPGQDGGRLVQNSASQTIWLYVAESGGRVLPEFDASVLPKNAVTQPGPIAMLVPICADPTMCDDPPYDPPPPPASPPTYSVRLVYFNDDAGHHAWEPVKNVAVTVTDAAYGASYGGQTDADGRVTASCPANPGGSEQIVARLSTPGLFQVQAFTTQPLVAANVVQPAGFCVPGGTTEVQVSDNGPTWYHQQMLATVEPSRSLFQVSRGFLGVNYDRSLVTDPGYYDTGTDEVILRLVSVYSEYGRFITSHEYGHAVAFKSLGGATSGSCQNHDWNGPSNIYCALMEGWADYFGALVRRAELPTYYPELLTNVDYTRVGGDGSKFENAVANFLIVATSPEPVWNISTGVDVGLHYPPSYIAASLRDCRLMYRTGTIYYLPRQAAGSDDLVWCLEGGVDWNVYLSGYFSGRGSDNRFWPSGMSNPAARPWNWSQADIRRTWLRSLYGV